MLTHCVTGLNVQMFCKASLSTAGHGRVSVHMKVGCRLVPTVELLLVDGRADFKPLEQSEQAQIEEIAFSSHCRQWRQQ